MNFVKSEKVKKIMFFIICFLYGFVLMSIEMLGFKMLAPYFGSDIFVWANIIGIFLLSISMGNYFGGKLSSKNNILLIISLFSLILLLYTMICYKPLCQWISRWYSSEIIVEYSSSSGYGDKIIKPLVASILVFFPIIFFLSMISPVIIKRLTTINSDAGKVSGRVYAISTAGNLLGTFLTSFYLVVKFTTNIIFLIFFIIFIFNIIIIFFFKLDKLRNEN